jgi:predicted lipoprotein
MTESLMTGRVIRIAVGPAFAGTSIRDLSWYIRQAWLAAENKGAK